MPRELGQDLIFLLLGVPSVIMPALVQLPHPTSRPSADLGIRAQLHRTGFARENCNWIGENSGGRCAPVARDVGNARGRSNNMAHELLVGAEENSSEAQSGDCASNPEDRENPGPLAWCSQNDCLETATIGCPPLGYAAASAVSRRLFTLSCAACTFAAWRRTI
jgi:hypothetical protein